MVLSLRRKRQRLGDESGVSAIEFAIAFPISLLVVVGLIVHAIYFGTVHSVQQLAAETARASVAGLSADERSLLAHQHVQRAIGGYPLIHSDPHRRRTHVAGRSESVRGRPFL